MIRGYTQKIETQDINLWNQHVINENESKKEEISHPDNALEVCGLLTPLHIVPEWYFLCQYAMLKAVPNKNAGFIILLTSIFIFFFFGEIRNLTTLCLLNNNGFSLSSFFELWNLLHEISTGIQQFHG